MSPASPPPPLVVVSPGGVTVFCAFSAPSAAFAAPGVVFAFAVPGSVHGFLPSPVPPSSCGLLCSHADADAAAATSAAR